MSNLENAVAQYLNSDTTRILPSEMHKMFPQAIIEPKWDRARAIESAPYFALRLALGGKPISSPGGKVGFVEIMLDGEQYIVHEEDFETAQAMYGDLVSAYLSPRGFTVDDNLPSMIRYRPDLILCSLRFLKHHIRSSLDVPANKVRVFWILPDRFACGFYRSQLPAGYLGSNSEFHVDLQQHCNPLVLSYYDAIIYSRSPGPSFISMLQRAKLEGKVLIYDTDDDLFSIPAWNLAKAHMSDEHLQSANTGKNMADLCITTTEHLAKQLQRPDVTHVCPNLMAPSFIAPYPERTRRYNPKLKGFRPIRKNGQLRFQHARNGTYLDMDEAEMEKAYQPITIAWFGSNTHDGDLEKVNKAIARIVKEYGMAVRFVFFGFLPNEFADARIGNGNANLHVAVREEFSHCVFYLPGVSHTDFPRMLQTMDADFGICPLAEHEFNLSKSNIKPLEFACLGIPSIVSNYGPYKFINHGVDGWTVDNSDTAWYNAICMLIENDDMRISLGQNARERMLAEYSWETDSEQRRKWDKLWGVVSEMVAERKKRRATSILDAAI